MNKPCYHCHSRPVRHGSNFCAECSRDSRPLFFPTDRRTKRNVAVSGLLYTGAAAVAVWLIVKAVEVVSK